MSHIVSDRQVFLDLHLKGTLRIKPEGTSVRFHFQTVTGSVDFQGDVLYQRHHAQAVDTTGQVIVETVKRAGFGKAVQHLPDLSVRERAAQ